MALTHDTTFFANTERTSLSKSREKKYFLAKIKVYGVFPESRNSIWIFFFHGETNLQIPVDLQIKKVFF